MSDQTMSDQAIQQAYVSSAYVHLLFDYLDQHGHAAETLLQEPRPKLPANGLGRYPMQRWQQLLVTAANHLQDPELGLRLGQSITPAQLGIVGYVILACANLGEAMQRLAQYARLVYDASPMQLRLEENLIELEWSTERGKPGQLVDATAITALVQFARDISDQQMAGPSYISFVNAAPQPVTSLAYEAYFGCPVAFEQTATVVRLPRSDLALRLRQPDAALANILSQQAEQLLSQLPEENATARDVRRAISQDLQNGSPSLASVATQLQMSERSLQRRLDEANSSFQNLLDDTRYRLAKDYLQDQRLTLAEIALLLGYSEQSAFNRSYKRWSGGLTPKQSRAALANDG